MGALAHHKHWEVLLLLFVGGQNEVEYRLEGALVLVVRDRSLAVSANINTIYFFELGLDLSLTLKVGNRNDDYARLLQELNMSLGDIADMISVVIKSVFGVLLVGDGAPHWLSEHSVDRATVVRNLNVGMSLSQYTLVSSNQVVGQVQFLVRVL